jgi:energy-coupling factor transporter ATP-binding protein EcfA2
MPDLNQDLRDWLHTQPDWLQQAVERHLATGSLSEADLQACVSALKTSQGQAVTTTRSFPGLTPSIQVQGALRLVDIGAIVGIENLGPRQPLAFGTGNLCVIYGHNGSGKSSYTRLLKKVCGKARAKDLKPNVFLPPPAPATRTCTIRYQSAGVDTSVVWQPTGQPIDDLRAIDLFDADEAMAYLTTETAVTYTPPAVKLLEDLAGICDRAKACLQQEQDRLRSTLPSLPPEYQTTATAAVYGNLKPSMAAETLSSLTTWGATDEQAHAQLTERLKSQDPAAQARAKRGSKAQIDQLIARLNAIATAFSEPQLAALRAQRQEAEAKRRSATESARVASANLDGIGTETWRDLWMAARAYSQIAYPDKVFPVTDDALCILCHQKLDGTAQQRLKDFESFVQGKVEADAAAAEQQFQQALQQLPAVWTSDEIATRCQAAGLTDPALVQSITTYGAQATTIRVAMVGGEMTGPATATEMPAAILADLQSRSHILEAEAKQHDQDSTGFDRAQAAKDKLNLEARRWTAQQATAIQAELARLRQVDTYENWKRLANSRGATNKAAEVAEKAITEAFVRRFNAELKLLGATRIQVELVKTKTTKGKVLHRIRLKGAQSGQDIPDAVLSDGERRIIALAAFIADVVDKPYAAPFIFDDPISSLDHDYEWSVATRLAELAQQRQVLVLTHRLSLFGAMEDAAKKLGDTWKDRHLHQHCIESFNGVSGHPANQDATTANTKTANNILINRLNDAKKAGDTSGASAYRALAQGICSDFRKLIERTVEDDLLNQVVRRHRRSVQTDNRLSILTHISSDDCTFFDRLMTNYSCYEHSQSTETPVVIPEEAELRFDLEALKTWREGFKKRPQAGEART